MYEASLGKTHFLKTGEQTETETMLSVDIVTSTKYDSQSESAHTVAAEVPFNLSEMKQFGLIDLMEIGSELTQIKAELENIEKNLDSIPKKRRTLTSDGNYLLECDIIVHRTELAKELVASERSYVSSLKTLIDVRFSRVLHCIAIVEILRFSSDQ